MICFINFYQTWISKCENRKHLTIYTLHTKTYIEEEFPLQNFFYRKLIL